MRPCRTVAKLSVSALLTSASMKPSPSTRLPERKEIVKMHVHKTGKEAQTTHGLRPITIVQHHAVDEEFYPVFKDGNPVYDGWEVIAIANAPNSASAHRHFGIFPEYEIAKAFTDTLPDVVPLGYESLGKS